MASMKNMFGKHEVEPTLHLDFNKEMWSNIYAQDSNSISGDITSFPKLLPGSINPEAIEDAVLKILEKHGIYSKTIDPNIGYEKDLNTKTFTLDEVIKIIDSTEKRLNVNTVGIWENKTEELIDKHKLIEKFKQA